MLTLGRFNIIVYKIHKFWVIKKVYVPNPCLLTGCGLSLLIHLRNRHALVGVGLHPGGVWSTARPSEPGNGRYRLYGDIKRSHTILASHRARTPLQTPTTPFAPNKTITTADRRAERSERNHLSEVAVHAATWTHRLAAGFGGSWWASSATERRREGLLPRNGGDGDDDDDHTIRHQMRKRRKCTYSQSSSLFFFIQFIYSYRCQNY